MNVYHPQWDHKRKTDGIGTSVPDQNPQVFEVSQIRILYYFHGSGSGPFCQQAKNFLQNLILLFCDFFTTCYL